MDWSILGTALGALAAGLAEYKRRRERARRREAERTAQDLQRILEEAHRIGDVSSLSAQANIARARARSGL